MRTVGTTSRGVRCPVVREGDDLVKIVTDAILACGEEQGLTFHDRDIVAVTEAVVARSQGNYAGVEDIAADCRAKFGADTVALTFPILSRNRIAICLKGIAKAFKKVYILMSYPSDEVGNHLFDEDLLDEKGVNPWSDVLDEAKYRELFGYEKHPFTGVDYVEYYGDLFRAEGCEPVFLFGNDVRAVLPYTKNVLCCDIHTRERSRRRLLAAGAEKVLLLSDLMTAPVNGSGYNEQFGLLGSNKATEESVKLFPRDCRSFVDALAQSLRSATGRQIEVMVYGDGAFKDPVGKIWELADPVVSPAYTSGLEGQPEVSGGQRFCLSFRRCADQRHQGQHLPQKCGFEGPNVQPGHYAPPPDRPDRQPVRPDLRLRRQGDPHHPHPGLFRQFCRINRKSTPIRGWGCFSVAGLFARPAHIRAACPYSRPRISSAASAMYWASGFSGRPAMCAPHLATGMSTL